MPLVISDPKWYRAQLVALAGERPGGGPMVSVWTFLISCVEDDEGWTWELTKSAIAQGTATSRTRVNEALTGLTRRQLILDTRRKSTARPAPGHPGLCYRLAGVGYYTQIVYLQGTQGVSPGYRIPEKCTATGQHLSLVVVADSSPAGESGILPASPEGRQQQQPEGAPPGYTIRGGNGHSVPPGDTIDLEAAPPEIQAVYWLRLAGVTGTPALELAQRLPPAEALAWALEAERWRATGAAENPPGLLVTLVRAGSRPPAAMQAYAAWLLEDPGALVGLSLVEIAGGVLWDEYQRVRYVSGEYADYVDG